MGQSVAGAQAETARPSCHRQLLRYCRLSPVTLELSAFPVCLPLVFAAGQQEVVEVLEHCPVCYQLGRNKTFFKGQDKVKTLAVSEKDLYV